MNFISRKIKSRFSAIILQSLFILLPIASFAQHTSFNIEQLGAKGDNKTVNTNIINQTIAKCSEEGGGTVIVPQGIFLTATLYLKSNVNIHLNKGAVLKGVSDMGLYHSFVPETDLSKYNTISTTGNNSNSAYDTVWTKALIIAQGINKATISGEGHIDGDHVFNPKGEEGMRGPHTIVIANCKDLRFENITIEKAANYAVLAYDLQNSIFQNVKIQQGWDGIHIRGGKNILLKQCELQTGDDALAGGFWENFRVQDCSINSACNGIRVIMPVNGFFVNDSRFTGPGKYAHRTSGAEHRTNMLAGIYIQPGGWGLVKGNIEGVHISNLKMHNMNNPFIFELHQGNNAKDIVVEHIRADSIKNPIAIHSDSGYTYKSVLFKDVSVHYITHSNTAAPWALGASNVEQLRLENVKFYASGVKPKTAIQLKNISAPSFTKTNVYSADHTEEVNALNSGQIKLN
jgi:hypothetical protein